MAMQIVEFMIVVVAVNLPFGAYRTTTRKLSVAWFAAIHLPIPVVIVMRTVFFHLPWQTIPLSIVAAVIGQLLGARIPIFRRAGVTVETN